MGSRIRTSVFLVLCVAISVLAVRPATAQQAPINPGDLDDLSEALRAATGNYADAYVQPVTDAFGAGMNSALFRTADAGGGILPMIDIYVGVSVTGTLMASSDRTFIPEGETISLNGQTVDVRYTDGGAVPTAFGSTDTPATQLELVAPDGSVIGTSRLPSGVVDTPVAPLLIPQLGVGTAFGTDVMLRYLPRTRIKAYGTVGVFGVGVRHSISQYIPMSPFDLAVQGAYNSVSLEDRNIEGDVLDASGWAFNLQASKSLPVVPVTFYGGLQYETFSSEYAYEFNPSSETIDPVQFSLDQSSSNRVRGLAGVTITLAVVRINVDYSLSANDVVTAGIGVQL